MLKDVKWPFREEEEMLADTERRNVLLDTISVLSKETREEKPDIHTDLTTAKSTWLSTNTTTIRKLLLTSRKITGSRSLPITSQKLRSTFTSLNTVVSLRAPPSSRPSNVKQYPLLRSTEVKSTLLTLPTRRDMLVTS